MLLFQNAINGYAGLLLDTDWSRPVSFESFLSACNKVVLSLKQDKGLPKKLIDSNRYLEWIKSVKDRHGSVEESSMKNVTQIDDSGVYTISHAIGIQLRFKQVDEDEEDSLQSRNFSRDDLSELRSKLMLISIKTDGKRLVDRFVKTLESVEVVYQSLEDLIVSGCHLFAQMKVLAYCNEKREVSLVVNFGLNAPIIQGGSSLVPELDQLAAYLKVRTETS